MKPYIVVWLLDQLVFNSYLFHEFLLGSESNVFNSLLEPEVGRLHLHDYVDPRVVFFQFEMYAKK